MRKLCFFSLLLFFSTTSSAKGLSPYLPLNMSPEIELQIEQLMTVTDIAPLTKPYKASDVLQRLKLIEDSHPLLHQRLSGYLHRFTREMSRTHLSINLNASNDTSKVLPNQRNINTQSSYQLSAGGFAFANPYAYVATGVQYDDESGLEHYNTHLGLGNEYVQMELGYREHWFSPFADSAMLVSTHAKASPSITFSNATPITDWNIRYEVFYSKLEEVEGIRLGDELFPGKPSHAGIHLSFTPWDFWTIGFNRTLQFGGGKRKVTVGDALEAIFNPVRKDNIDGNDGDDPNFEFGNQQASITSKWNFNLGTPVSLYAEIAGEDTVSNSNFKLGNQAYGAGLFLPQLTQNLSFRYEYNHWTTRWYVHHLYQQGYTNDGQVMGHWGGGERDLAYDTPATSHSFDIGWTFAPEQMLRLKLRSLSNETNSPDNQYVRAFEGNLTYSFANQYGFWGVDLYSGKSVYDQSFHRISVFYRW